MALLKSTLEIIEQVESLSNRPVRVMEDATIQTLATICIARGDSPMHLVRYKPAGIVPPDYFIAYQCGFALRLFSAPEERRFDFAPTKEGRVKLEQAMWDARVSEAVRNMGDYLLSGILTQLRTYPIGLRIDEWLLRNYPELRPLQKTSIQSQLNQNVEALKSATSGQFPRRIVKANLTMNAAFALFWGSAWSGQGITLPYKAAGYMEGGLALMKAFRELSDAPASDPDLVDNWAEQLGLRGWYERVPFILNP